ncbi:hypothetical protein ACM78Z_26690 [Pseudomonas aeruginosa]
MANSDVIAESAQIALEPLLGRSTARSRTNLSIPHLLSACLFSRQVLELERLNAGLELGSFWDDIIAHASASMLLTVAALESYVNELFADHEANFQGVRTEVLVKLWDVYETKPFLDKVDLALLLRDAGPIDRSRSPAQDVGLLIRLRNALTHFKPEWFDEQEEHAKLSAQLGGRFTPSPFFPCSEPIFPRGWASHSCTAWAIGSAIMFIKEFEIQGGLTKRLEKFETRLIYK